jgi:hypothetical protein
MRSRRCIIYCELVRIEKKVKKLKNPTAKEWCRGDDNPKTGLGWNLLKLRGK